jgi:hypothetical protein
MDYLPARSSRFSPSTNKPLKEAFAKAEYALALIAPVSLYLVKEER